MNKLSVFNATCVHAVVMCALKVISRTVVDHMRRLRGVQILHNISLLRVIAHELPTLSVAVNDLRQGYA